MACPRDGGRGPEEAEALDEPAPTLAGVTIGERVGSGGYATAWRAAAGADDAIVKVAHRTGRVAIARLAREYEVLRRLGGGPAPRPIALGELSDGRPYILMTRVAGEPLSELLAAAVEPWTITSALAVIDGLCGALDQIHARGVVHGDLKPENILVAGSRVSLVDFGTARANDLDDDTQGMGTIEYMAPEQLHAGVIDVRTDLYAVGVILFELVAGRPPFVGDRSAITFWLRNARPPLLRQFVTVSPAVEDLVAGCLSKQLDDRPPDAATMLRSVRALDHDDVPVVGSRVVIESKPPPRATCALLAVSSDVASIAGMVRDHGGALARRKGSWSVFVFEPGRRMIPVRAAALAAAALGPELASTIHVATLAIRRRGDGTMAFFGPELDGFESWASQDPGVTSTELARQTLEPFDGAGQMIGRDDVMTEVLDLVGRATSGSGPGLVQLCAETGFGKTMLLAALALQITGARVVSLRASPPSATGVSVTARDLLEQFPPGDELDEVARAAAAWTFDPLRDNAVQPLAAVAGALRAALARALTDGLVLAATRCPTVLLLDDAHLADAAILDALASATRTHDGAPLVVIAAARPELARDRPGFGDHARLRHSIQLAPLAGTAATTLCRTLLAPVEVIPESIVERLCTRTKGRPLELVELIAALRRDGAIYQSERGRWEIDASALENIPESRLLRWLAERTYAELSPPLLAHARLVGLLGGDVTARDLREVITELDRAGAGDQFPLDVARGLEMLCDAGVLVRSHDRYRFRHALLGDLGDSIDPEISRTVHTCALAAYTRRTDLPFDEQLARRATHAHDAGFRDLSGDLHVELGARALARHRYIEAELAFTRSLDGSAIDRGFAHWQRAIARYRLGRHGAAATDLVAARAASVGDRAREAEILLDEAMSLDWAVEYRAAAERVTEAAVLVDDNASPRLRAYLAMSVGRSHIRANREADALDPLQRAITLATPLGDSAYEILVVSLLQSAPILATLGRLDEAREHFDHVLALTTSKGDRMHQCAALANRLWRPFATPDLASLWSDYSQVLAIANELGHFVIEFTAEVNFAGALHHLGHRELALVHVRKAVELERRQLGEAAQPEAAMLEARILVALGRFDEARAAVTRIELHQVNARAANRAEALVTEADALLLDAVRIASGLDPESPSETLEARAVAILPRHELAELRKLVSG